MLRASVLAFLAAAAGLAHAQRCPNGEGYVEQFASPSTLSITDGGVYSATGGWSNNAMSTWGQSFMTPDSWQTILQKYTLYFTRVPDGLQATALLGEYNTATNALAGPPIWQSAPFTITGYSGAFGVTYPFTVEIPGGIQLDPTKVYAALLTNIGPNRGSWPAQGLSSGATQETGVNILPGGSPLPARGSIASAATAITDLQTGDTFNFYNARNGQAFWAEFVAASPPLNVTSKANKFTRQLKMVTVKARAGRTVKITYKITNPTSNLVQGYNFVVQTGDCANNKWSWPIVIEPGKTAYYTVPLKINKCTPTSTIVLESGIEGTVLYGPTLAVDVEPLTKQPSYC